MYQQKKTKLILFPIHPCSALQQSCRLLAGKKPCKINQLADPCRLAAPLPISIKKWDFGAKIGLDQPAKGIKTGNFSDCEGHFCVDRREIVCVFVV